MKTNIKAYGIAAVLVVASILGFITPAADGSSFFMLPLALLVLAVTSALFGLAGQFGTVPMRQWVANCF